MFREMTPSPYYHFTKIMDSDMTCLLAKCVCVWNHCEEMVREKCDFVYLKFNEIDIEDEREEERDFSSGLIEGTVTAKVFSSQKRRVNRQSFLERALSVWEIRPGRQSNPRPSIYKAGILHLNYNLVSSLKQSDIKK
jgi:hypothetical protein